MAHEVALVTMVDGVVENQVGEKSKSAINLCD